MKLRSLIAAALLPLLWASAALAGTVDIVFLDSFEAGCGNLLYAESFTLSDASPWPAPWTALGNVSTADIQQGMARLQPLPTTYSLARMGAAISNSSVEVRFTLRFEDLATQGIGFYVRQNGGYLQQTATHGQGYAAFIEGDFRGLPGIGLWKELDGTEVQIAHAAAPAPPLAAALDYRVRLQVLQSTPAQTLLRAKLWPASDVEPGVWQVSFADASAALQNVTGAIALDSWSNRTSAPISAYTFVDNIELISLCTP
jgi:hypothetical protein